MNFKKVKRYAVLGILFFLPVTFLLFLYPATHNYTPLDIVKESVLDLDQFTSDSNENILLKDHITVLGFFGKNPLENVITASNLKELVYDKFKGFKKFQIVLIVPEGVHNEVEELKKEIISYEDLKFWYFSYAKPDMIERLYNSLKSNQKLNSDLTTNAVFIIDKDLNQRGRIDDRSDNDIEKNREIYGLSSYDCIEVAEIKNKMSEDIRILFTEYRQKRKGNFDSTTRRANDLITENEKN